VLTELAFHDATALAELVRARALSSAELARATIERIEAFNPQLCVVVTPMFETAIEQAEQFDASAAPASRSGRVRHTGTCSARVSPTRADSVSDSTGRDAQDASPTPFSGVPFLVKDLIATCAGVRQTEGSRMCADRIAARDSELVRRLRAAGLVIVGKTNTSELGSTPVTENGLFGATRNPWDLSLSPAGSSGGSAAAVAAGIVPMAHGNDSGGSLRNPASCCGVFGFKPSRGRMPLASGQAGEPLSRLLVEHALTRSVRDSARLLDATYGALHGDRHRAPAPEQPFIAALESQPSALRIALSTRTPTGEQVHPECVAAAERAALLCEQLGHHVTEAEPSLDGDALVDAWFEIWAHTIAGMALDLAAGLGKPLGPADVEPLTWRWCERSAAGSAREYLSALRALDSAAAAIARFLEDHDAWLTPTLGLPAIPVGAFDPSCSPGPPPSADREQDVSKYMGFSPFARLSNVTGFPAMSVPVHWTADGMPVGAHFMGRQWEEHTLLALAAQLERVALWADRRPRVSCGSPECESSARAAGDACHGYPSSAWHDK
jgi:amidase